MIEFYLNDKHEVKCNICFIGRTGENEAEEVRVIVPDCVCDKWLFLDFEKPDGTKFKTPKIDIIDGVGSYRLGGNLVDIAGMLKIQAVLEDADGVCWKSEQKEHYISKSIDATEELEKSNPSFISEAQTLLDKIETGLTPTIGENENWFICGKDTGKTSRGEKGDAYIVTDEDMQEVEEQVKSDIQPVLENIEKVAAQAENIAKGKSSSVVKETWAEMEEWLKDIANKGTHNVGDNLYIKAKYTDETMTERQPDYWIAEVLETPNDKGYYYEISELEADKPDLTDYTKQEQFVTLTQDEYDALEEKSANTYYFIIEEE